MKKIIFIAGPVRGDGSLESQKKNIEVAKKYVKILRDNEIPYYSPHLNIDQEIISSGESLSQFSWDLNAEFLLRCDGLGVLPGWETSNGTKEEIKNAENKSLPVFYLSEEKVIEKIKKWLSDGSL